MPPRTAPDEALRLIEAERTVRGGIYADDAYAWVLFRAGRIAEARQASDRAFHLGTPDARLLTTPARWASPQGTKGAQPGENSSHRTAI
jgi:hypothetical protein